MIRAGVFFGCLFFLVNTSRAQLYSDHPDSIFVLAKEKAAGLMYSDAIFLMKDLHENYANSDYSFFLAQLYYWSGDFHSAYPVLKKLSEDLPNRADILELLIRVANSLEYHTETIAFCETGKTRFPDRVDFYRLQQAIALTSLDEDERALEELNQVPKNSPLRPDVLYQTNYILRKQKNMFSVGYLHTRFDDGVTDPIQLAHVEYSHRAKRIVYVGRVNYGNLSGISALQAELDGYIRLKKGYLYSNVGFSDGNSFFPLYRLGAEYYYETGRFTTSAGARYLDFKTQQVLLLTAHVGWNGGAFRTTYRPYAAYQSSEWFFSHVINLRYTLPDFESYLQLDLQYGGMPYYFFVSDGFERVSAYRIGLNCNFRIHQNYFLRPVIMYEREEYFPDLFRNRYNVQLILSKRF